MSIPITKRVMMGGKKGCGCGCDCQCGNSPAKQAAYPKALKEQVRNAATREERNSIIDSHTVKSLGEKKPLSRSRAKALKKAKERLQAVDTIAQKNCYGKKK